jgi:hypothetical protein
MQRKTLVVRTVLRLEYPERRIAFASFAWSDPEHVQIALVLYMKHRFVYEMLYDRNIAGIHKNGSTLFHI